MFELPIHPVTGLRALGIGKRGPVWPVLGASEDDPEPKDPAPEGAPQGDPDEDDPAPPAFTPITSQEQFDKLLGKRLGQQKAQFAGYDDYKAKAAEYDKLEDAKKTAEQRLSERLAQLEKDNEGLRLDKLRSDVAIAKGLPPKLARRLTGSTKEELEADADDLLEDMPAPKSESRPSMSQKPKENLRGGGRPDEEPEETDPRKLAAKIPR